MVIHMVNEDLSIKHTSRVIYTTLQDGSKAYLKYRVEGDVMILEETFVPERYRGVGVAAKLVEYAINYAKQNNLFVKPECSYTIRYFIKNRKDRYVLTPEYRGLGEEEFEKIFQEALMKEKMKKT